MTLTQKFKRFIHPPSNVTNGLQEKRLKRFLDDFIAHSIIIDLGAGRKKASQDVISMDIYKAPGVDILGDINDVPLISGSIDGIIARGVLEHIPEPDRVVSEMYRVLKPGGRVYSSVPFIQGYHPSPGDYQRYTKEGLKKLFSSFETIECTITRGSASSFIWITREFLSQVFSFNITILYKILKILFGWFLQPVKLLDPLTEKHKKCHIVASGFTFIGNKPFHDDKINLFSWSGSEDDKSRR